VKALHGRCTDPAECHFDLLNKLSTWIRKGLAEYGKPVQVVSGFPRSAMLKKSCLKPSADIIQKNYLTRIFESQHIPVPHIPVPQSKSSSPNFGLLFDYHS
jgi:hypothetical protein